MLRHVQCTSPNLSWLLVVVAACSLAACGGSIGSDSVTGSPVGVAPADTSSDLDLDLASASEEFEEGDLIDNDDGTFSTSHGRHDGKVLVCHKGRKNLWVSKRALPAHEGHGDRRGRCGGPPPPSAACPCFSSGDINSAASTCSSNVAAQCGMGDPAFLLLSCDPGGTVPPGILGIYLSQTAAGGSCSRDDVNGTFTQNGLTDDEFQACVNLIDGSGFCQ